LRMQIGKSHAISNWNITDEYFSTFHSITPKAFLQENT
jgi:hypothetical protein